MPGTSYEIKADVKEFKNGIKEAQSALKALDAEAKLNQAQMKASGDAENYAANNAKILAQRTAELERIAKTASAGMETLARAGQENSVEYNKMREAYAQASAEMAGMTAEQEKATAETEKQNDAMEELSSNIRKIGNNTGFSAMKSAFSSVHGIVQKIANYINEIEENIKKAAERASGIMNTSYATGLSAEELQRYQSAAQIVGVNFDNIARAMETLNTAGASNKYAFITDETAMKQWAVVLRDENDEIRNTSDAMWDLLDILTQIEHANERDRISQEYFGAKYAEIVPLIRKGREAWEEYINSANVATDAQIEALDSVEEAKRRMEAAKENANTRHAAGGADKVEKYYNDLERYYNSDSIYSFRYWQAMTPPVEVLDMLEEWKAATAAAAEAGESSADNFTAGVLSDVQQAYDAGAALGSAIAAGAAAAAGAGAYGGSTNNTNYYQYFGNTNISGVGREDVLAAMREQQRQQLSGYGG